MASGASRQDLRHVSPFSSGSCRRLAIEPQLLAQPGAIDHPPLMQHQRLLRQGLQVFETGSEDFMTGGWVRVLASAEQVRKDRPGMERAAKAGLVRIHGTHRGVLLVEFLDVP